MNVNHLIGALAQATGLDITKIETRGTGAVATYELGDQTFRVQFDCMPVNHDRRDSDTKE